MHFTDRLSGVRIEVWMGAMIEMEAELEHPPQAMWCPVEWKIDKQDVGRVSELTYPLAPVLIDGWASFQLPSLSNLTNYLLSSLPGSTAGPPFLRRFLCLSPTGANTSWFTSQLIPSFLYHWYWEWKTREVRLQGEEGRRRDAEYQHKKKNGLIPKLNTKQTLDAAAKYYASNNYFPGTCVALQLLRGIGGEENLYLVEKFLEYATQQEDVLPWAQHYIASIHTNSSKGNNKQAEITNNYG